MENNEINSEFGKGFLYPLALFAMHIDSAHFLIQECVNNDMTEEKALWMWVQGAADHLYECEIPPELPRDIKEAFKELKESVFHWKNEITGMPVSVYKDIKGVLCEIFYMLDDYYNKVEPIRADYQ